MNVADLLRQSVAAHNRAAELRRKRNPEARKVLVDAHLLRLEALTADPKQEDPAWKAERVPHEAMMAFYSQQLGAE